MPILGFKVANNKVTTTLPTMGALAKSEATFICAVNKNRNVASLLEIAEEFYSSELSLPAVIAVLHRSPVAQKLDDGLYKIRGSEISWEQIEAAQKRQKRIAQNDDVSYGLDGIIRLRLTITSYAFLTGVVGAYRVKDLAGEWPIIYQNQSYGRAKIADMYLWGLSGIFKELSLQLGDRVELGFNTWERNLSLRRI